MALFSPNDNRPTPFEILEAQLRECYGRVVYTHKTHEKCADILLRRLSAIKIWQIVLSALTTGTLLLLVLGVGRVAAIVGGIVSTILLVLNAYIKSCDLGELAQKHKQAAVSVWLIREKYLSLITDLRMGTEPLDPLLAQRDALLDELHSIYVGAPATISQAYRYAQKALKVSEDMTFSDAEIDAFLPDELRKKRRAIGPQDTSK